MFHRGTLNLSMIMKSASKKLILLAVVLLLGCAGPRPKPAAEDIYDQRAGSLPLVLRFPAGMTPPAVDFIGMLEKTLEKNELLSVRDHWILARHYHTSAAPRDRLARAEKLYRLIIVQGGADAAIAANNLGCLLVETGKYREGEELFQGRLGGPGGIITAYYNLTILYRSVGRDEDALKVLALMKERYPENAYALIELGTVFMERERYAQAGEFFREAMEKDRDNPLPLHYLALVKEKTGDLKEAEALFEKCIGSFPYYERAYIDYSAMLLRSNREKKARDVLNRGIRRMEKAGAGCR